jgi:acetylornithine/succinyldiaminopimelate/putrescine aminotransferase
VAPTFGPGDHGTTFGGGPLACRLGFEFVKILQEEELLEDIREKGDYFETKLLMLKEKYSFIVDVRGEGLMLGMQLDFPARDIVNRCLEAGFIINVTSDNVLRFLPPYIITKKEIGKFIKALDQIFSEVAKERAEGVPEAAQAGGH